jgi:hypothetical protein
MMLSWPPPRGVRQPRPHGVVVEAGVVVAEERCGGWWCEEGGRQGCTGGSKAAAGMRLPSNPVSSSSHCLFALFRCVPYITHDNLAIVWPTVTMRIPVVTP